MSFELNELAEEAMAMALGMMDGDTQQSLENIIANTERELNGLTMSFENLLLSTNDYVAPTLTIEDITNNYDTNNNIDDNNNNNIDVNNNNIDDNNNNDNDANNNNDNDDFTVFLNEISNIGHDHQALVTEKPVTDDMPTITENYNSNTTNTNHFPPSDVSINKYMNLGATAYAYDIDNNCLTSTNNNNSSGNATATTPPPLNLGEQTRSVNALELEQQIFNAQMEMASEEQFTPERAIEEEQRIQNAIKEEATKIARRIYTTYEMLYDESVVDNYLFSAIIDELKVRKIPVDIIQNTSIDHWCTAQTTAIVGIRSKTIPELFAINEGISGGGAGGRNGGRNSGFVNNGRTLLTDAIASRQLNRYTTVTSIILLHNVRIIRHYVEIWPNGAVFPQTRIFDIELYNEMDISNYEIMRLLVKHSAFITSENSEVIFYCNRFMEKIYEISVFPIVMGQQSTTTWMDFICGNDPCRIKYLENPQIREHFESRELMYATFGCTTAFMQHLYQMTNYFLELRTGILNHGDLRRYFNNLPVEVIEMILNYLPYRDLAKIARGLGGIRVNESALFI